MHSEVNKLIIYDQDCSYCVASAKTAERLTSSDTSIVQYEDKSIQSFLSKQFEDKPFTLIFVDTERNIVAVGDDAIKEINKNSLDSKTADRLFSNKYQYISSLISLLTGRKKDVDMTEGRFKIKEDAKEELINLNSI
jgi:hypothetical protein